MKRLNFAQLTTDRSSGIVNYQLNLCKRTKTWTAEEEAACMTRIAAHEPDYEKLAAINIKNILLTLTMTLTTSPLGLPLCLQASPQRSPQREGEQRHEDKKET